MLKRIYKNLIFLYMNNTKFQYQFQNGRVINVQNEKYKDYDLFDQNNNNNDTFKQNALKQIQWQTPLSSMFFSIENMKIIQNSIRYQVYIRSGKKHIVDYQSNIELEVVMRAIYLQYAQNLNCKFVEQIKELNNLVVEWCTPRVLSEVQQYLGYLDDIQKYPVPIELPVQTSQKGTRTLRSVTSTF
jgi:hypothetical protein